MFSLVYTLCLLAQSYLQSGIFSFAYLWLHISDLLVWIMGMDSLYLKIPVYLFYFLRKHLLCVITICLYSRTQIVYTFPWVSVPLFCWSLLFLNSFWANCCLQLRHGLHSHFFLYKGGICYFFSWDLSVVTLATIIDILISLKF